MLAALTGIVGAYAVSMLLVKPLASWRIINGRLNCTLCACLRACLAYMNAEWLVYWCTRPNCACFILQGFKNNISGSDAPGLQNSVFLLRHPTPNVGGRPLRHMFPCCLLYAPHIVCVPTMLGYVCVLCMCSCLVRLF